MHIYLFIYLFITYITLAIGEVGHLTTGRSKNAQEYVYGDWHRALSCLYSGCLSCTGGF